ncbi:MAG: SHOCT domain-containing protein [Oscillospiraceae bacterium]|jgi:hypothetical protein|nr:SHOCT domain-containing protein [Oscillospiraceae bacterium]
MDSIMSLQGQKVRLDLYEDHIDLVGTVVMSLLGKGGVNTIPLSQISSVQFVKATALSGGWLHFSVPGSGDMVQNIYGAARNRNAVVFSKKENDGAERIRKEIEERMKGATAQNPNPQTIPAEELIKLKQLLDSGIITQDDFEKKKAMLLGI